MTMAMGSWLRRHGLLPWGLGFVMFVAYDVALGLALTGRSVFGSGMSAWFLVWLPSWLAQLFAPATPHPYPRLPYEYDPPQLASALTGICWALMVSGALLYWTAAVGALQLNLPNHGDVPWFVNAFVLILGAGVLGTVPSAAMRAHRYTAEQSRRVIAAESARSVARAQVLQSQMQPHFLFNALNTVTALLREDPARGKDVLLRLRGLLERSLTTVHQPMIPLRDEVSFVRDQLAIEQERFRDRLRVTFDVDPDALARRVPAFCLQPLVENALRHGIGRSLDGGRIHVRVSRESGALHLEVQDAGAGLDPRWREGTGLSNLRERLAATYGPVATLSVTTRDGHTVSTVTIPPA